MNPVSIGLWLVGNWRQVGLFLLIAAIGGYIAVLRIERDSARSEYQTEHQAFTDFKVKVAAEGEIARQRAEAIAAHDELLKEEADSDHQVALDRLHADLQRVRHERDAARSSYVSAIAASTNGSDRACFDPAKLTDALRSFDAGVLGIVESGSKAVIDLDSSKEWARGLQR